MIVKDSQLQKPVPDRTEWPITLTPQQREQLLREKMDRAIRLMKDEKTASPHRNSQFLFVLTFSISEDRYSIVQQVLPLKHHQHQVKLPSV